MKEINTFPTTRLEVSIDSVFPNKWNPNVQTDRTFRALVDSVKNFGFIAPILVRELPDGVYEIIDGEHKYTAAKELAYTKVLIDNLGIVEDSEAKTLTLMMNNVRGQDDIVKRAKLLKQISENHLGFLPFAKAQMEEEMKLLDFDFSQFTDAKVDDKIDLYSEALKAALTLERKLRDLHNESSDTQLKLLIEGYFDWINTFKQLK